MDMSNWLSVAGIGVSASTLAAVGFGAVWLQHNLETLRLKREVFRRVVGSVHSIVFDCQIFGGSHSFSESGIVAVNEIRAVFVEQEVLDAWRHWYFKSRDSSEVSSEEILALAELIHAMSVACKLKHYQRMDPRETSATFACSCVRRVDRGDSHGVKTD